MSYPNPAQLQNAYGTGNLSAKVEEKRKIDIAFDRLTDALSGLNQSLVDLEERAAPYLKPEPPSVGKERAVDVPNSMTVSKIGSATDEIGAAILFINRITERLD